MMERNENNSAVQHSDCYPEIDWDKSSDGSAFAAAILISSVPLGVILWIHAISVLANAL